MQAQLKKTQDDAALRVAALESERETIQKARDEHAATATAAGRGLFVRGAEEIEIFLNDCARENVVVVAVL